MSRCTFCLIAVLSMSCGGQQSEAPAPPISTAAADALAPAQAARAAALLTEIKSTGQPCASVTRTFLQGQKDGGSVWNAECSDGPSYGITSKAGGSTEVLECSALERTTGTKCFTKF